MKNWREQSLFDVKDVATKKFMRHIQRNHSEEDEVRKILQLPQNSKERREACALLRNNINFDLYIQEVVRPYRQFNKNADSTESLYYPCAYCKGLFIRNYLRRHAKVCKSQKQSTEKGGQKNHLGDSQTVSPCAMDLTNVISKLNIKEQVFGIMKADEIAFEAKKDLLIAHFGESYLKKHKRERMAYCCSNRVRELFRLLIAFREIVRNDKIQFKDLLSPKHFDNVIHAARKISGYDHVKKDFKAPSLAMHLGTSLKTACDELIHLILRESKGYKCHSPCQAKVWLKDVKKFKELVQSRWTTELASLANKDLFEKRWNQPLLLPLVSDIQKFREEALKIASDAESQLFSVSENNNQDARIYKILVQSTLALLILFNRRRIGDVQYLKIKDYNDDKKSNTKDFENALTEAEKVLTTKYRRVINSGKGSRAVVILVPEILQKFIASMLQHRDKFIPTDNEYVFAIPGSTIKWGKGDVAIKNIAKKIQLEHPETISSNKLRKQIATVMQILSMTKDESKQFANFMGHTQKTHDEFYELPVDIYQTAKVSKLLLLMERGTVPVEYKGKSLREINLDVSEEYAEEDKDDEENTGLDNSEGATDGVSRNVEVPSYNENSGSADEQKSWRKSSQTVSEESEDEIPKKKMKSKKPVPRKGWSDKEIKLLKKTFMSHIRKRSYPSGEQIKEFLKDAKINRSVAVVKSKIQHLMKLK